MPLFNNVRDAMDRNVQFVEEGTTVKDVLGTMIKNGVWAVVVAAKGVPLGVVTEHDILRRCDYNGLDASRVRAEEIMSSPIILIDVDAPIGEALATMVERGVRRLFIADNGKIVGRITEKAVLESTMNVMLALKSYASAV